jgi:hypothetical protein
MTTEVKPVVEGLRSVIADDVIAAAAEKFGPLTADTKEGYRDVKEAIAWCRTQRGAVEAKRKNLNEEALKWQRTVNAEAKRITSSLEAIEEPLKAKKQAVDDKVERERAELAAKHQAWINGRIAESVEATGKPITTEEAETWTDEQFAEHLEAGRKAKAEADAKAKAEAARLAQEDADRKAKIKAEQDQIAADREALVRQKAEQDAEAKRIKDEQDQRDRDIEAKLAKIQEAEERAARIQPATVIGENDLAGKVLSESDPLQPIAEAMSNFFEFPFPGFPEAEAAEDLKGESRDALVLVSSEIDDPRSLIAPNYSEIIQLLETIQVSAARLDALFDDPENVLDNFRGDAQGIMGFIENLQYEMDRLAPK